LPQNAFILPTSVKDFAEFTMEQLLSPMTLQMIFSHHLAAIVAIESQLSV
jgi:hypothetical protein